MNRLILTLGSATSVTIIAIATRTRLVPLRPAGRPVRRPPRRRTRHQPHPDPGTLADLLERASRRIRAGDTVSAALATIAVPTRCSQSASADSALAAAALAFANAYGASGCRGLDAAASALRDRAAIADERRAQAAQALLSAKVLTVLPLAVAVFIAAASPTMRASGFLSPVGLASVGLGGACNAVGWVWMRRVVRQAL